jgi:protein-S-isoprenylcysteine O-methyltransferase Ste14
MVSTLNARAARSSVLGAVTMAALLFLPAGALDYWQAWIFMAVFVGASAVITVYLAKHDPQLLERRMKIGPAAEREVTQKVIMSFAMLGFIAMLVVPPVDHRFGWSRVPPAASLAGDGFVALGFLLTFFVLKANPYGASTIQVAENQKVISTGPYGVVRHPTYAGVVPLLVGTPVALGSWWGLLGVAVIIPVLVWRLLDEERFLRNHLIGYTVYARNVRFRLLPFVW